MYFFSTITGGGREYLLLGGVETQRRVNTLLAWVNHSQMFKF